MARGHFHVHETARQLELEGAPLATFPQRLLGFIVDLAVSLFLWAPIEFSWRHFVQHRQNIELKWDFHEKWNLLTIVLYWATAMFVSNGRSLGKWAVRSRVVSLVSPRLGLWQSIERALGYGVAAAEVVGALQFFWSPNHMCVHDRIAETIVVDERRNARRLTPPGEPSTEAKTEIRSDES